MKECDKKRVSTFQKICFQNTIDGAKIDGVINTKFLLNRKRDGKEPIVNVRLAKWYVGMRKQNFRRNVQLLWPIVS